MNLKKKIEAYLNESPVYVAGPEKFFRDVEISDTEKKRIKNSWNEVMSYVPEDEKHVASSYLTVLCEMIWKIAKNEGEMNPR